MPGLNIQHSSLALHRPDIFEEFINLNFQLRGISRQFAGSRENAASGLTGFAGGDAVAIGDTPYDASAAGKAGIASIGVLCGGFTEKSLREAGCAEVYPGPAALLARFPDTLLAR